MATSVTLVPTLKSSLQSAPQLMPGGLLETLPVPPPDRATSRCAHAADVNVMSAPLAVPALFAPTTRKWYAVLQASPVIAADTATAEAPAASGLCAAVTLLP